MKTAIVYRHDGDYHALLLDEFDQVQCANWEAFCESLMLAGVTLVSPERPDQMPIDATVAGMNIDGLNRQLSKPRDFGHVHILESAPCQQK